MKLFEQPLEKLFSPKKMKQLNQAIKASKSLEEEAALYPPCTTQNKRKRSSSAASINSAASLRKFSTFTDHFSFDSIDSNNNNNNTNANANANHLTFTGAQRQKLLLSVLPEPIRKLLNELYLRGPSTVGIFRKSPNAKHCKELRQKLESDSTGSVEQFQVTVIASVFKEWLRSLPDCLLMSRLYPQWIDVAKLIEPLHQHQLSRHQSQMLDDSCIDSTMSSGNTSLRTLKSPLTDSGQAFESRAHSCSAMLSDSEFSFNKISFDSGMMMQEDSKSPFSSPTMSAFALSDRHSECLRIVRQLLDALNEHNLILLRLFICVLWNIANNSEFNKMSANNLGVCVGQSLLNDEHQSNGRSGASTFSKRHIRSRSQCLLSSTLSLNSPSLQHTNSSYLDSSSAQETTKYVPMLVAFIIENAPALFGTKRAESTSSSGASSSTSGVHSESPAFSSDCVDSQNTQTTSASSSSPSPSSSVSSPSSGLSRSPLQDGPQAEEEEEEEEEDNDDDEELMSKKKDEGEEKKRGGHKGSIRPLACNRQKELPPEAHDDPSLIGNINDEGAFERYHQNRHKIIRYCTFMGILNRMPKLPVQFATSNYGGEAVIYNPRPVCRNKAKLVDEIYSTQSNDRSDCRTNNKTTVSQNQPSTATTSMMPNNESVISVKPIHNYTQKAQQQPMKPLQQQQNHYHLINDTQQYHSIAAKNQQELRQQRLEEFLARQSYQQLQQQQQQHHNSYVQVPYLPQSSYVSSQAHPSIVPSHHQQAPNGFVPQVTTNFGYSQQQQQLQQSSQYQLHRSTSNQAHAANPAHLQHQIVQHQPIFYSATNLSSLQQIQQQDRYMLYHRASMNPQRSHVMSLRDYYLSLQQRANNNNQQYQQQPYHRHNAMARCYYGPTSEV